MGWLVRHRRVLIVPEVGGWVALDVSGPVGCAALVADLESAAVPVSMRGTCPAVPLWAAIALSWVQICTTRELREYRFEALKEISTRAELHSRLESVWRLGGRVAVFDFLRELY